MLPSLERIGELKHWTGGSPAGVNFSLRLKRIYGMYHGQVPPYKYGLVAKVYLDWRIGHPLLVNFVPFPGSLLIVFNHDLVRNLSSQAG